MDGETAVLTLLELTRAAKSGQITPDEWRQAVKGLGSQGDAQPDQSEGNDEETPANP